MSLKPVGIFIALKTWKKKKASVSERCRINPAYMSLSFSGTPWAPAGATGLFLSRSSCFNEDFK